MTESSDDALVLPRFGSPTIAPGDLGRIPDELIWEILTFLPVKSLMRFKCVSRAWRAIIMNPLFAKGYRGGFRGLLIVEPNRYRLEDECHFFYVSLDGPSSQISHQLSVDHGGSRVGCTHVVNGLVCFYYRRISVLYNIATREKLRLPLSANGALACSYHLGFDPVGKLYKLLKICPVYDDYDIDHPDLANFVRNLNCEILTIGVDSAWRSINPPPVELTTPSVCLDGDLFWMEPMSDSLNSLIVFHLSDEKFQIIPTPGEIRNFNLLSFGNSLALTCAIRGRFLEALMIPYVKGNTGESEGGVWGNRLQFVVPVLEGYNFYPWGVLPNGRVLIFDRTSVKRYPAPLYLYDPSKSKYQNKWKYQKIMIDPTPASEELLTLGSFHGMFYLEENIIPLRYLNINN